MSAWTPSGARFTPVAVARLAIHPPSSLRCSRTSVTEPTPSTSFSSPAGGFARSPTVAVRTRIAFGSAAWRPWTHALSPGSRRELYKRPRRRERHGDVARLIRAEHLRSPVAEPFQDLRYRVSVLVGSDAHDRKLGIDREEELLERRRGAVVRHLQHVGAQINAVIEHHLLCGFFGLGGEEHGVLADARAEHDRVVVRIGLGARPTPIRREDLDDDVLDDEDVSGARMTNRYPLIEDGVGKRLAIGRVV